MQKDGREEVFSFAERFNSIAECDSGSALFTLLSSLNKESSQKGSISLLI